MAYVKILNLKSKGAIKNASAYVENEKKTDAEQWKKTVSGVDIGSESRSIRDAVKNVSSPEIGDAKNEERLVTGINCLPSLAAFQMQRTADYWRVLKERSGVTRDAFHIIQSFDPKDNDRLTPELAHKIGIDYARSLQRMHDKKDVDASYRMLVCTHVDKGHLHNHIVMCSYDIETGMMFHECREVYRQMRESSDRLCRENGLSVIEEPDNARRRTRTEYEAALKGESWKENLRKNIDIFAGVSDGFEDFKRNMESAGYKLKVGKYITYEDLDGHKVRDKVLGREWTRNALEKEWADADIKEDKALEEDTLMQRAGAFFKDDKSLFREASKHKSAGLITFQETGNMLAAVLEMVLRLMRDTISETQGKIKEKLLSRCRRVSECRDYAVSENITREKDIDARLARSKERLSKTEEKYRSALNVSARQSEILSAAETEIALKGSIKSIESMPDGEAKDSMWEIREADIKAFRKAEDTLRRFGFKDGGEAKAFIKETEPGNPDPFIEDVAGGAADLEKVLELKRTVMLSSDSRFVHGEDIEEPVFKEEALLQKAEELIHQTRRSGNEKDIDSER